MKYFKTQLPCLLGANTLHGWSKFLQKAIYALNQCLIYVALSLIARIHASSNQEIEVGVVPFTITSSNPLENFLFPFPMTLCPFSLKVVSQRGNASSRKKIMILLKWKLKLSPSHFGFLIPLN